MNHTSKNPNDSKNRDRESLLKTPPRRRVMDGAFGSNLQAARQSLLEICDEADLQAAQQEVQALHEIEEEARCSHQLFKLKDWRRLQATKVSHDHLADKIKSIRPGCGLRPLVMAEKTQIKAVERLAEKYRNFSGFLLDYLAPQICLQAALGEPLRLQNFVLVGPPGIGKTALLSELAGVLGLGSVMFDASTLQAAHVLNGLTRNFATSDTGLLFKSMVLDQFEDLGGYLPANALICVDEIEKVGKSDSHGSVLDLMLSLLEQRTAARFVDVAVPEMPLDLSRLNWCFTANSLDELSAPLRSRLIAVEIPAPTTEQSIEIAASIFAEQLDRLEGHIAELPDLSYEELERLAKFSPRQQRQMIELGIARAHWKGLDSVLIDENTADEKTCRMGFL